MLTVPLNMEVVLITKVGIKTNTVMKNIFRTFFALAAIVVIASCTGKLADPSIDTDDLDAPASIGRVPMTFTSSSKIDVVETRTIYDSPKVLWESTDKISLFAVGHTVTHSDFAVSPLETNKALASFSGLSNPDADTYYASYPYSPENSYDHETGKFIVTLPAVQTAVEGGFQSGANVSVAYLEGESTLRFRNVATLISFAFNNDDEASTTAYVVFKAIKSVGEGNEKEYWGLSGSASVGLDSDNKPFVEEGSVQYVTLNAPEGGFKSGIDYYIPVYPVGECAGWEVIYVGKDNIVSTKTNNLTSDLQRNSVFVIGAIPEPCVFEMTIDFTNGSPFTTDYVSVSNQTYDGESYIYRYPYVLPDGTDTYKDFQFMLRDVTSIDRVYYEYGPTDSDNKGLYSPQIAGKSTEGSKMSNAGIVIMLPALEDWYLQSFKCTGTASNSNIGRLVDKITATSTTEGKTFTFPSDEMQSNKGQTFYYKQRRAEMVIYTITLRYTKTNPN